MPRNATLFLAIVNLLATVFLTLTWIGVAPPNSGIYRPAPVTGFSGPEDPEYLSAEHARMGEYVALMERLTARENEFIQNTVVLLFIPTVINLVVLAGLLFARARSDLRVRLE